MMERLSSLKRTLTPNRQREDPNLKEKLFKLVCECWNTALLLDRNCDVRAMNRKLSESEIVFSQEQQDYAILESMKSFNKGRRAPTVGCLMANGITLASNFKEDNSLGEVEKLVLTLFTACSNTSGNDLPSFKIEDFTKSLYYDYYDVVTTFLWAMHIAIYYGNTRAVAYLCRVAPQKDTYSKPSAEMSGYSVYGRGFNKIEKSGLVNSLPILYAMTMLFRAYPDSIGSEFFANRFEKEFKSILADSNMEQGLRSKLILAMIIFSTSNPLFEKSFARHLEENEVLKIYKSLISGRPWESTIDELKEITDNGIRVEEDLLSYISLIGYYRTTNRKTFYALSGASAAPSGKDIILGQNAAHAEASIIAKHLSNNTSMGSTP